jgi:hypothetical protein
LQKSPIGQFEEGGLEKLNSPFMAEFLALEERTNDDYILAALNTLFTAAHGSVITRQTFAALFELVPKVTD